MRVALDTNVMAYAEGLNGVERRDQAVDLIARLPEDAIVVPAQALGELFHVLVRKAKRPSHVAREAILAWRDAHTVADTTSAVLVDAVDLSVDHGLTVWDAIMLAAAADAGCRLLLSEDLQHGFTWRGVSVVDPFAGNRHPLLDALLQRPPTAGVP